MLDINTIRKDFPQLSDDATHYLDSSATSLTPMSVLGVVEEYYMNYRANVHRGLFPSSLRATKRYEETRKKVANFIGASDEKEIIFTSGATESSNVLLRMIEESGVLKIDAQNFATTQMEHHSSLLPLQQLAKRMKRDLLTIPMSGLDIDYVSAEELITKDTALVAIILASNVTGVVNDVRRVADIAHRYGAIVVVDATAAMGHIPVSVEELGADALYFSGHKMFAPTGVGVLWVNMKLLTTLTPAVFGGGMVTHVEGGESSWSPIPHRFEAGTKDIGGVIGLGAAIDYISAIGLDVIQGHSASLAFLAIDKLGQIPGVRVFSSSEKNKNIGIVSFVCDFAHPHDVAEILARDNVAVRPGHHCAIPLHDALGVTATTRASFHVYNTKEDVDALVVGLLKVKEIFIN